MAALLRFLIVILIAQTVIYICVSAFARAHQRQRLSREWASQETDTDEKTYIARAMSVYEASLRRRLLYGIYVVPLALVLVLVYVTNFM